MRRPARIAEASGANGERPLAIRSALTKTGQSASLGKNSRANVVLPAPFGPARITILFPPFRVFSTSEPSVDLDQGIPTGGHCRLARLLAWPFPRRLARRAPGL